MYMYIHTIYLLYIYIYIYIYIFTTENKININCRIINNVFHIDSLSSSLSCLNFFLDIYVLITSTVELTFQRCNLSERLTHIESDMPDSDMLEG